MKCSTSTAHAKKFHHSNMKKSEVKDLKVSLLDHTNMLNGLITDIKAQ